MLAELEEPRDIGKKTVIAVLGGGTRDMAKLRRRPDWLHDMKAEAVTIQNAMMANPEHREITEAARARAVTRSRDNLGGMVMTTVLQAIEDKILVAMVARMRHNGVPLDSLVLVFDGVMVPTAAMATVAAASRSSTELDEEGTQKAFLADLEADVQASTGWRVRLAIKPMDEAIDVTGLTRMAEDVTWHNAPPAAASAAAIGSIVVATPRSDPRRSRTVAVADIVSHRFARLPDATAVAGLARSDPSLREVLDDATGPVRLFFRLTFPAAHCASTEEVVTQFLGGVLTPRIQSLFGSTAVQVRSHVAIAHSSASTAVHIVTDVSAPTLAECFRVCSQVQKDAIALSVHRLPALRKAGPRANTRADTLMDMTIYAEGGYLPILGTRETTTSQVLTPYSVPGLSSPASSEVANHLVTLDPGRFEEVSSLAASSGTHRVVAKGEPLRPFSSAECVAYAKFLNAWHAIPAVLGGEVVVQSVACVNGCAHVKVTGVACPFGGGGAGHVVMLVVDDVKCRACAVCGHARCAGREVLIDDAPIPQTDALDRVRTHTLHTQDRGIEWGESYCEPQMRPLPRRPFVCVRAQMGIGKTKAIVRHVAETCASNTSILLVSYSVDLCRRTNVVFTEGTGLDFALYLDTPGEIEAPRTTVCLDSLRRCSRAKYDLVIMDEANSVLAHFNSPLMKESGIVSHKLEHYLATAGNVLFVDAVCDSTLVKLVVDRIESLRNERAFWVRNNYVRSTNRHMNLHVYGGASTASLTAESPKYRAMDETFRRLRDGKNVVHVSNIRSHVVAMETAFKAKYPDEPYAAFYGEGPVKVQDPAKQWSGLRCLMYSPAVPAGISFELPHYRSLVAYIEIAPYAPSIDSVLQSLYRVRDLSDGAMDVFIKTFPRSMCAPNTVQQVTDLLMGSHALTKRYLDGMEVHFEALRVPGVDGDALYDRSRMSWDILVGTTVGKNRSLPHAPSLMITAMREDYGIEVTLIDPGAADGVEADDGDSLALALEEAQLHSVSPGAVPFADLELELDDTRARQIEDSFAGGCDAVAHASLDLYRAMRKWRVRTDRVDASFYERFAQGDDSVLRRLTRWNMRLGRDSRTLSDNFSAYFSQTLQQSDPNLEIHKRKRISHWRSTGKSCWKRPSMRISSNASTGLYQWRCGTRASRSVSRRCASGTSARRWRSSPRSSTPNLRNRRTSTSGSARSWSRPSISVERKAKHKNRVDYHTLRISPDQILHLVREYRPGFMVRYVDTSGCGEQGVRAGLGV